MLRRMKRPLALTATTLALLTTACAGTAGAATTVPQHNPIPHCVTQYEFALKCTCPPGWSLQWAPWWEIWNMDGRWCVRET